MLGSLAVVPTFTANRSRSEVPSYAPAISPRLSRAGPAVSLMSATGFLSASAPVVDVVIFGVSMKLVMLEESMQVQRVVMPGSGVSSWTVLGDDDVPVGPIERYLTYLTDIDRSPNTVKAYAHDLKDYWGFLQHRGLDWREVRLEDIGEYVAWLSLPPPGRAGRVAVLPSVQPHVAASTTNRKLSALSAFYAHHARHGVDVGELLTTWQVPGRRGGWKPFLHHVSKGKPQPRRSISVKVPKKIPRVLTVAEMQRLMDACDRLRDRFLLALLWDSGVRIGEALGLRHCDIAAAECEISVVPRLNENGARSKSREQRTIPVSAELIRLWG